MRRCRLLAGTGALIVLLTCSFAYGQTMAATKPAGKDWLRLLDTVPSESVAFVAVQNINGFAGKVQGFLKGFVPSEAVKELDPVKSLTDEQQLGETFDTSGSFAMVLLDPKRLDPRLMKKLEPDDDGDVNLGELRSRDLPVVFLLPGKDPAKMFPGRKLEPDGELTKLTRNGSVAWVAEKDGFVACSFHKRALQAFSSKVSALVGLTAGDEKLAMSSDVLLWVNRKKAGELAGTAFEHLVWSSMNMPKLRYLGPMAAPIKWFHLTRDVVFRQAERMVLGFRMTDKGPWGQLRVHYAADSVMGRTLSAARCTDQPLTAWLPDKPYIFAYGARKDIFQTPASVKKLALEAMKTDPALKGLSAEVKANLGAMIAAVNEQVTGVQHWAGQGSEMGPLGIANVVRCKDSAKLRQIIRGNLPVFQAMLNLALGVDSQDEERFSMKYDEAAYTLGDVKLDAITVSHPKIDEMLKDEDMGQRVKNAMVKAFPGETKFRLRLAALDKDTMILILGGGKKFAQDAIAAAKAGKTALELADDAKSALAMLPPERFAVAMVNVPHAISFGSMVYMTAMGMSGAQLAVKPAPPVVVALSADKSDLVITAYLPRLMFKRVFAMLAPLIGGGVVEESDDWD
ncbi:MAG TPA: hypothetical protein VNA25_09085 [Phycisphaerae bacterium]|nr:hypothetical protein [Phycisphaerae bacterium]